MNIDEAIKLIGTSALFDEKWYVERYPDVQAARLNPATHYFKYGWKMSRDPSAAFSTSGYLDTHIDVKKHGMNPLLHYLRFGYKEGRAVPKGSKKEPPYSKEEPFHRQGMGKQSEQLKKTQELLEYYYTRCQELEYKLLDY